MIGEDAPETSLIFMNSFYWIIYDDIYNSWFVFIFAKNLLLEKFEGNIKYDNAFSKFQHKYQDKTFLIPNLGILILATNFAVRLIWDYWFQL